jgi:transposase
MRVVEAVVVGMTPERRAALEALLRRTDLKPRIRERAEMVKAAVMGQDLASICRWGGRTPDTVRRWLRQYQAEGAAGIADAPRSGRPAAADSAYHAALEQAMGQTPRDVGLLFDVWDSGRLSAYLAEQTGVRIAPSWLRTLLGRHQFVTGRPKHTLRHLQDADAVAACEAELAAAGEKGGPGAGALRTPSPR